MMAPILTKHTLWRTAFAAGVLGLILAIAPVAPTVDMNGYLSLSPVMAHAKGKGGGRGGHGHRGADHHDVHGHAVGQGHFAHGNGRGLGHEKARGYGHHHDPNYAGEIDDHNHHGHDGHGHYSGHSGQHTHDHSFSGAMENAQRDFGRARSEAKALWGKIWK